MVFFTVWGFLLWLGVTITVRLAGHLVNLDLTSALLIFVATVPLIAAFTYPVYTWRNIEPSQRPAAAVCAVLPGMLLDVFAILFFPALFPNLLSTEVVPFAAWLFWGYSLALLTGFIPPLTVSSDSYSSKKIV